MRATLGEQGTGSKNSATEEAPLDPLVQACVDALLGEFCLRPVAEGGASIPFLFKLFDYLSILLFGQYHLSLWQTSTGKCVSTNSAWHIGHCDRAPDFTVRLTDDPVLELVAHTNGNTRSQADTFSALQQTRTLVRELVRQMPGFNSEGDGGESVVLNRLEKAFWALTNNTLPPCRDVEFQLPPDLDIADETLAGILRRVADRFNGAWSGVKTPFSCVFRYYGDSHCFLIRYVPRRHAWCGVFDNWRGALGTTIATGFAQLSLVSKQKAVLFVPCHFGGTPWVVMCYEVAGDANEQRRAAYQIYRDLGSRINTAIRLLAQASFAEDLRYLFSRTIAEHLTDAAAVRRSVVGEWEKLGCVYPISPPTLQKGASDTRPEVSMSALRFPDGEYCLVDSETVNRFAQTTPPFEHGLGGESWSSSLGEIVRDNFIRSMTDELRFEDVQRQRAIADATYVVGHPLKARLGLLGTEMEALCALVESDEFADKIVESCKAQLETCSRVTKLMHLISSWHQARAAHQLNDFLAADPLDLDSLLSATRLPMEGEMRVINVERQAGLAGRRASILPFNTRWGQFRLQEYIYREIIFELFLNARYGPPLGPERNRLISIDAAKVGGNKSLIFSNLCETCWEKPLTEWIPWREGEEGGLRFVSEVLELTESGSISARCSPDGGGYRFAVRMVLKGLDLKKENA